MLKGYIQNYLQKRSILDYENTTKDDKTNQG